MRAARLPGLAMVCVIWGQMSCCHNLIAPVQYKSTLAPLTAGIRRSMAMQLRAHPAENIPDAETKKPTTQKKKIVAQNTIQPPSDYV